MSATIAGKVYQSKWGFHAISRETYDKLRFINGVYAKAQHSASAWSRWENKMPSNRFYRVSVKSDSGQKIRSEIVKDAAGNPVPWPEPQICSLFHTKAPKHVSGGYYIKGKTFDNGLGERILEASRQARTPMATPEEVEPFPFTEKEIDQIYEQLK